MSNLAKVFEFEKNEVRTIIKDNEPWFVAKDVCDILGIKNSRDSLKNLDDDEKGVDFTDTLGGKQEVNTVNESGLYNLIFKSNKEGAKKFKRWVTHEVLPSIRKTGGYSLPLEQSLEIAKLLSNTASKNLPLVLETLKMAGINLEGASDSTYTQPPRFKVSELSNCLDIKAFIREFMQLYPPIKEDKTFYYIGAGEFREYCRNNNVSSSDVWNDAQSIGLLIPRSEITRGHSIWLAKEGRSKKVYLVMKMMLDTVESEVR
jgi:prophage antirepressor-like protein